MGALIYSLVSVFQSAPGYMDAEYYTATGVQLASGNGFREPFIWNYLNNPQGLPAPSHLYWMPLASIMAALGGLIGGINFIWMRVLFILTAALLVPAAVAISRRWVSEKRFTWLAGVCAAFSGVYWIYLTLPETFGLYMLTGAALIGLVGGVEWLRIGKFKSFVLGISIGILTGLMHLTRADGILWLAGGLIWIAVVLVFDQRRLETSNILRIVIIFAAIVGGYFLIMGAWYLRNINLFGTLMPPGNSRVLWLTDYNQTYNLTLTQLTYENWTHSGAGVILLSRWEALKLNLANFLVGQGGIVFLPLTAAGIWKLRKDNRIRFMLFMWLLTFLTMTIVFPFAGARGGYFHSSAAFQLYFWALAAVGLEIITTWGAQKRGWNSRQAFAVFGSGLAVIAVIISVYFFYSRVIGKNPNQPVWNQSERAYQKVDGVLNNLGISDDEVAVVNNPPGFYLATGRPSIVVPNGGIENLLAAARRYDAGYLILEQAQANLQDLYASPGDQPGLDYLTSIDGIHIFRILMYE